MTAIKPLTAIAEKWSKNAAGASDDYRAGVSNPRRSWSQATQAADEARKEGLAAADQRDAFRKGVAAAGDAKWKQRATTVGPGRYRQGVQVAKPEYQKGFARYHSVIANLTLPPRGPKGSPENIDRVRAIADALHKEKVGG